MAPRKVAQQGNPEENHSKAEEVLETEPLDEQAMQQQIILQTQALLKLLKKQGVKLEDVFETPPPQTTLVVESAAVSAVTNKAGRLPGGTVVGGGVNPTWVPWSRDDLDTEDTVTFVPQPVPSLVFPIADEEGRQKIKLDVNDLVCWLTVGVPNTITRFFYHPYIDAYNVWRELEKFKRTGPEYAPWGRTGPDGRPSWMFIGHAQTYGMDIDGRALSPGRKTIDQVEAEIQAEADGAA